MESTSEIDLEPRNAPGRSVDMFLDLAATEEDHGEVCIKPLLLSSSA